MFDSNWAVPQCVAVHWVRASPDLGKDFIANQPRNIAFHQWVLTFPRLISMTRTLCIRSWWHQVTLQLMAEKGNKRTYFRLRFAFRKNCFRGDELHKLVGKIVCLGAIYCDVRYEVASFLQSNCSKKHFCKNLMRVQLFHRQALRTWSWLSLWRFCRKPRAWKTCASRGLEGGPRK